MDPSQPFSAGAQNNAAPDTAAQPLDPRLQPTPDYGTLGPGSDAAGFGSGTQQSVRPRQDARFASIIAALVGIFIAVLVGNLGRAHRAWPLLENFTSAQENKPVSAKDLQQLDRMGPQRQAETLLKLAVAQNATAPEQIESHLKQWQGKLRWDSQMASLTTAALNSNDMRVRESGVEVELAAYGLAKDSGSLESLLKTVESTDHSQKIWALWSLGLMANRGVQAEQVLQVLISHLRDSDEDSRHWAVESLALTGSDQAIEPLLKAMHDDPSALVRERAACGIAQSGLFTPEQRMTAVPQLLNYTDDPALDASTHSWAFHALNDITHQNLPNDSAAWRSWYEAKSSQ
jgi:HEAT repeats